MALAVGAGGLVCALSVVAPLYAYSAPGSPPEGYSLSRVSDALPGSSLEGVSQLAFDPRTPEYLYAVRTFTGKITRYDYASDGQLSQPFDVATGLAYPVGLAFKDSALYVTQNVTGDGRIARLRDLDHDGFYEERSDFVRNIPRGDHQVNQLQIRGETLWTSIGQRGNNGNPIYENVYTGTLVRIADLSQIDYDSSANYLPDSTTFVDPAPVDGYLRRYARGFRNAFGVRVAEDGGLWVTDNGASACSTCSARNRFPIDTPDLLYRDVRPGDKGIFPPPEYPGGGGATIQPCAWLDIHSAATGFDFVPSGPDAGMVLVAEYGPTDTTLTVGRDVVLVDPENGNVTSFIEGLNRPTDLMVDPSGRILIADYGAKSIYLLVMPETSGAPDPTTSSPTLIAGGRIERMQPNPFARGTEIVYFLPRAGEASILVFDAGGRRVRTLEVTRQAVGQSVLLWDGRDDAGHEVMSGVYRIRLLEPGRRAQNERLAGASLVHIH